MKIRFKLLLAFILFASFSTTAQEKAKKITSEEFKVSGVCKMCKKRIEKAALIKGVKLAQWDKDAQKIKVTYRTKKVELNDIHKAIAEAGHDTALVKAEDEDYEKLPDCCLYRDGVEIH